MNVEYYMELVMRKKRTEVYQQKMQQGDDWQQAWQAAEEFFLHNHSETNKFRRHEMVGQQEGCAHSFIRTDSGQILLLANESDLGQERYAGSGAFGKVKIAVSKDGQIFVVKIEDAQKAQRIDKEKDMVNNLGLGVGDLTRFGQFQGLRARSK